VSLSFESESRLSLSFKTIGTRMSFISWGQISLGHTGANAPSHFSVFIFLNIILSRYLLLAATLKSHSLSGLIAALAGRGRVAATPNGACVTCSSFKM
jgi:hypothetical protein